MAGGKPDDDPVVYLHGADGWPLDRDEIDREVEARRKGDLQAARERWRGGDVTAFAEAVYLHWKCDPGHFPHWLVEASRKMVERALAEDEKRDRREWTAARTRWEALTELRERWPEVSRAAKISLANAREALKAANDAQNTQERDRLLKILPALMEAAADDRGANMERAREAVAEALKASDPEITARAVKDAFEIVEAAGGADATLQSYLAERRRRWRKKHFGRSAPDHSV